MVYRGIVRTHPPPYGPRADLLKRGGGADTFPISFFQGLSFLHLEITLPFAKLCYTFEKKQLFFLSS